MLMGVTVYISNSGLPKLSAESDFPELTWRWALGGFLRRYRPLLVDRDLDLDRGLDLAGGGSKKFLINSMFYNITWILNIIYIYIYI